MCASPNMLPLPGVDKGTTPPAAVPSKPKASDSPDSQASTVPGDDSTALHMAQQNNALRLKELAEQQQHTPQHMIRRSMCSTDSFRRVASTSIFGSKDKDDGDQATNNPSKQAKQKPKTTARKQKAQSNKKKTGKSKGSKKVKNKSLKPKHQQKKSTKKDKKQQIPQKVPDALPASAPAKAAPLPTPVRATHSQASAKPPASVPPPSEPPAEPTPVVPAAEPVGALEPTQHVPSPAAPAVASPAAMVASPGDVASFLNRAPTQDLSSPAPLVASPLSSQPAQPNQAPPKPKKQRDLALHARKGRFYRSMDSLRLNQHMVSSNCWFGKP